MKTWIIGMLLCWLIGMITGAAVVYLNASCVCPT